MFMCSVIYNPFFLVQVPVPVQVPEHVHVQCDIQPILPGPGPCPGDSQCEYTIRVVLNLSVTNSNS